MDNGNEMIAYKLVRLRKNGTFGSLFIDRKKVLPVDVWMEAEDHPTKNFAHRPGWHVTEGTYAPHLKMEGRVWVKVLIKDYQELVRPDSQGGPWYISKWMKIIGVCTKADDAPHKSKRIKIGKKFCDIDEEIVDLILTLNRIGLETKQCCQGDDNDVENHTPPYITFVGNEQSINRVWSIVCNFTKATPYAVHFSIESVILNGEAKETKIVIFFFDGKNAMESFKEYVKIQEKKI